MFFRKKTEIAEPPNYPVVQCINLIGRADNEGLQEKLLLSCAVRSKNQTSRRGPSLRCIETASATIGLAVKPRPKDVRSVSQNLIV
jgi:hypothetical protein